MDGKKRLKQFNIEVAERRKDGGTIVINTGSLDRDHDRVMPGGARTENYFKNPVVQWGHNYRDPWATIGRANKLTVTPETITADFTLRPSANEQDPMTVVQLLWDGEWIRTSSIGFIPKQGQANAEGGFDFTEWELLEFSLVPIPANQDALRLAIKSIENNNLFREREVWDAMHQAPEVVKFFSGFSLEQKEPEPEPEPDGSDIVWVRQMEVESNMGIQKLFAVYRNYQIVVPKDATKLMSDEDNGMYPAPHPHAGKTLPQKEVVFVPPIEFESEFGKDAIFSRSAVESSDEDMAKGGGNKYEVLDLSPVLLRIPAGTKAWARWVKASMDVCELKLSDVSRVKQIFSKRGRVISAKNEATLKSAREDVASADKKLSDVLSQLSQAEEEDEPTKGLNGAELTAPIKNQGANLAEVDNSAPTAEEEQAALEILDLMRGLKEVVK